MENIEKLINNELKNRGSFFVFPSELVASYWMKKAVCLSRKAVLTDRFLSWDKFKEKTFALNMNFTPVNKYIRTLFASSLLEENKKKGDLFKGIIRPEYSEGSKSFLSWITSILTEIKSFRESNLSENIPLSDEVRADLDFLYTRYIKFLDDKEMFEPSWIQAKIEDIEENYFLFFPNVIDDFKEFAKDLEKSDMVHIINPSVISFSKIRPYQSSIRELKEMLNKIGLLIDKGIKVQDIAITLPDMKGWRIPLEAEASLRSIPLDFRQGKSLSEYPGGKLFHIILNSEKSGFSLSSMKQMLLNNLLPWKDRDITRKLFDFGLKHHCFRNYRLNGREIDVWENALLKSKESELLLFYQNLKSGIGKISSGENFTEVKKSLQMFIAIFLDTSRWKSDTLREFQFCLNTLNDLEDASLKAGNLEYGSSCDIWLSAVEDRIYVKRSETTGINIFPYRVAAGASFLWHFIPGLSQDAASVVKSKYLFLKDNHRKFISDLESDFTDSFLELYNISGKNVVFSFSTDSFSGPALPPSRFVMEEAVGLYKNNSEIIEDKYLLELGYWLGNNPLPSKIFSVMKKGASFSSTSIFKQKSVDYTKEMLDNSVIHRAVTEGLINERNNLHISPSSLDQFIYCPYLFLFQRGFGVKEVDYREVFIDHPVFGQIIHECFDRFFKYVDGSGSEYSLSLLEEYKLEIDKIIDSIFNRYMAMGKDFIAPVWNFCRTFTKNKLVSFIEVEAKEFPGFRLAAAEKKYTYIIDNKNIELSGRIDRVSFKGDKTAIVDYKKKNHLKKADMKLVPPSTFQIPFYTFLVEKSGLKVSSASYYDVTNCRYDHVYNPEIKKSWCSEEDMSVLIDQLEKSVELMADRIKKGDYSVSSDGCGSCSFRRICRTKYHVR